MTGIVRLLLLVALASCAALAFACADDGSDGSETPATAGSPQPTATGGSGNETPGSFEEARDDLVGRLEDYSATIGALPDDVLADLLADCEAVAQQSDDEEAALGICDNIERAASTGDPGLVDRAIDELADLEGG